MIAKPKPGEINKDIQTLYINILKYGAYAKVKTIKDDVVGIELLKDMPGEFYSGTRPYTACLKFFYLYPRNPYTGEFEQ